MRVPYTRVRQLRAMAVRAKPCPDCRDPLCILARAVQSALTPPTVRVRRPSPAQRDRANLAKLRRSLRRLREGLDD